MKIKNLLKDISKKIWFEKTGDYIIENIDINKQKYAKFSKK